MRAAAQMKIPRPLLYALTGWVANVGFTLGLGFLWPIIFPGIVNVEHYYGAGPSLPVIIGMVILLASPAALIGGFVGSRLPIEGGQKTQMLTAAVFGILVAFPCGCWGLWVFSGW